MNGIYKKLKIRSQSFKKKGYHMSTLDKLGKRIHTERLRRELTLDQLSSKAGLSKSFLSQIERGLAQPSITSLKKIAAQFGWSVVNLFSNCRDSYSNWEYDTSVEDHANNKTAYVTDVAVVRADKRKRLVLSGSNVLYDLLTPNMNRKLEIMHMHVKPGENSGDEPMLDPPGEKFCLVLRGSLEVCVGNEVHKLEKGDTIYYPTNIPHSWRALEGELIEVIWVLTPPSF